MLGGNKVAKLLGAVVDVCVGDVVSTGDVGSDGAGVSAGVVGSVGAGVSAGVAGSVDSVGGDVSSGVVVSDGAQTVGRVQAPAAARRARALNTPVYTVVLGTPNGTIERTLGTSAANAFTIGNTSWNRSSNEASTEILPLNRFPVCMMVLPFTVKEGL